MDLNQFSNMVLSQLDPNAIRIIKDLLNAGINGIGPLSSAKELGNSYLRDSSYYSAADRIEALILREKVKNFSTGFLTSVGGFIALPLSIPASIGANWVLQTRMVAAIAHIGGFDIEEPPVKVCIALCLLGRRGQEALNTDISDFQEMLKDQDFSKYPKKVLQTMYQAIGTQLMKLATQKGFTRISKAIPVIGGVAGGVLDLYSCIETAEFAQDLFQLHKEK